MARRMVADLRLPRCGLFDFFFFKLRSADFDLFLKRVSKFSDFVILKLSVVSDYLSFSVITFSS